jgi:hypothetical protein
VGTGKQSARRVYDCRDRCCESGVAPTSIPVVANPAEQPGAQDPCLALLRLRQSRAPMGGVRLRTKVEELLKFSAMPSNTCADDFVLQLGTSASRAAKDRQVQDMHIVMATNRSVYYGCPIAPTLGRRSCDFWCRDSA